MCCSASTLRWPAVSAALAIALLYTPVASAQTRAPDPDPQETQPRGWLLVTGSLLFSIGYGYAAASAAFGEPTKHGQNEFGSPGLLYIPIIGPTLFDADFCSEASDHFAKELNGSTDRQEVCGSSWTLLSTLPQLLGATMIALAFAAPQPKTSKHAWLFPAFRLTQERAQFEISATF